MTENNEYLHITLTFVFFITFCSRQRDIGFEQYETKSLFLHLFYPTLLVIITVVQLQIFHKKYLQRLDLPALAIRENSDSGLQPTSSVNYGSLEPESSTEDQNKSKSQNKSYFKLTDLKTISVKKVKHLFFVTLKGKVEIKCIYSYYSR